MQPEIQFPTESPINTDRLKGQNKKLYDFLSAGNKITCFSEEMQRLGIGYLNSRISDLRKLNVNIKSAWTKAPDRNGELVTVKEYSIE